jgi:hypothetical protein
MADQTREKLTKEQKDEVRREMARIREKSPNANTKEMLEQMHDLPYHAQITVATLRGLAVRQPGESVPRTGGKAASTRGRATTTGRGRGGRGKAANLKNQTLEKLIGGLNELRKERDALDARINEFESEVRDRMSQQLGADHAGRIFGSLLKNLGDTAQRVGGAVGDTAQRVGGAVGDTAHRVGAAVSDRVNDVTGRGNGEG